MTFSDLNWPQITLNLNSSQNLSRNICISYIFWLKYTGWLEFHPDSTVLTTIWPLVTSERSWYRHFWNQQKKCYRLICILPSLKWFFIKIPISVDIGSFDVDLTPKKSKFDQTKDRNEILITFSYNIRVQNGDSLWVIFQASALHMSQCLIHILLYIRNIQILDYQIICIPMRVLMVLGQWDGLLPTNSPARNQRNKIDTLCKRVFIKFHRTHVY